MNIKNINLGKNNFYFLLLIVFFYLQIVIAHSEEETYFGNTVDIKILDKLSSKNKLINLKIESYIFKNLVLKVLKCQNSKFDDNPKLPRIYK